MATGDITWTNLGHYDLGSSALDSLMDAQSTGAATASADTKTFVFIPIGITGKVYVCSMAREA